MRYLVLFVLFFVTIGAFTVIGALLGALAELMVGSSHYGDWHRYGGAAGLVYGTVMSLRAVGKVLLEWVEEGRP